MSMYTRFISLALVLSTAAALGCDPGDEVDALELSDVERAVDFDDQDEVERPDSFAMEAPDPSALYTDCPLTGKFCFWNQTKYVGKPSVLPSGDFAISFDLPVKSMLKRSGTYRVKLFSKPNFSGDCAVFGLADKYADSPHLPFDVRSARRMEPGEALCP